MRAAYPDATEETSFASDSAIRVTDGDGSILFEFRGGLAFEITVLADEPAPIEFCG